MAAGREVRVWDLPTRLFHWLLVLGVGLGWWTASTHRTDLHLILGEGVAGLLVFRLWWGFFGGSTARFGDFLVGPQRVIAYGRTLFRVGAKGEADPHPGQNPMGGWSVAALLLLLIFLVGCGLFAVDTDGLASGPLSGLIDYDHGRLASHLHTLAFTGLEALVFVHLAAIAFYQLVKGAPLIRAMITGKTLAEPSHKGLKPGSRISLAVGVLIFFAVWAGLLHLSAII